MNKLKTSLFLCFCLVVSAITAQTYSGGAGTKADPYRISSKADMVALANAVRGNSSDRNERCFRAGCISLSQSRETRFIHQERCFD
ncbi:MAG: hypothetical protein EZS26_001169 [Candidatus Ordinivivax streblomastigis]|uniref:Uncharacterized protein n=1 Tax=Candidatus Ordinivivax streblomastigis TaxID=2540710 RepID=A0A5M8P2U3_9BACT|nr:MAG: hypothetical protein EZS26_001169 [Candidatus Ordinivivax streblomastigis]